MGQKYWYTNHPDASPEFFRDQHQITEEEWRREAPASEIARLDAEQRAPGVPFPKDIAAS